MHMPTRECRLLSPTEVVNASPSGDLAGLHRSERAELHRQGAKSAARGEPMSANPMDRRLNSPEATGESMAHWARRSRAWQEGHGAQSDTPRIIDEPRADTRDGGDDDER